MAMLSFDSTAAQALLWVASGAAAQDPESYLLFEPKDNTYTVSTNTASQIRSLEVKVAGEDSQDEDVAAAIRAKAIMSVAAKVDDESSLGVTITEDTVNLASGATTMTLTNHYYDVLDNTKFHATSSIVTLEAFTAIEAISRAVAASGKGVVRIGNKDDVFTITSGDENIRSQELLPASVQGDFALTIPSAELKILKALTKVESLGDVTIKQGTGLVKFIFSIEDGPTLLTEVTAILPTNIGHNFLDDNPCDEDIQQHFTVGKKSLSSAIKYIMGAVAKDSVVTLDASAGNNYITVKVADFEGSAKTTIIDAVVDTVETLEVSAQYVTTGLRSIAGSEVVVGGITTPDNNKWITLTPVFEEDAEDSGATDVDIVVAIRVPESPTR